jgi:hypothetical protein
VGEIAVEKSAVEEIVLPVHVQVRNRPRLVQRANDDARPDDIVRPHIPDDAYAAPRSFAAAAVEARADQEAWRLVNEELSGLLLFGKILLRIDAEQVDDTARVLVMTTKLAAAVTPSALIRSLQAMKAKLLSQPTTVDAWNEMDRRLNQTIEVVRRSARSDIHWR